MKLQANLTGVKSIELIRLLNALKAASVPVQARVTGVGATRFGEIVDFTDCLLKEQKLTARRQFFLLEINGETVLLKPQSDMFQAANLVTEEQGETPAGDQELEITRA